MKSLGTFDTMEEAAKAFDETRLEQGRSRVNFVSEEAAETAVAQARQAFEQAYEAADKAQAEASTYEQQGWKPVGVSKGVGAALEQAQL